jgi:hypothetical protein
MPQRVDLHIHSCLSPCGSLEMSPTRIVEQAVQARLNGIALTDHNTALHAPVMDRLCRKHGLAFLPGIEVTTTEEVHVLCLFAQVKDALTVGQEVYKALPDVANRPEQWGDQVVVNEQEEIEQVVEKVLANATSLSLDELYALVRKFDALFIPAHIDRPVFSLPAQLGFLPPNAGYDAVEITHHTLPEQYAELAAGYPVITGPDAHYLADIGRHPFTFDAPECSIAALRQVLSHQRS